MNFCTYQAIQLTLHTSRKNLFCNCETSNYRLKIFQKIWIRPNVFKKISTLDLLLGRNLKLVILTS